MERGRGIYFFLTLFFRCPCLPFFSCKSQNKKNKKKFPHEWVRSWLAYPKSLHFQVFSLFLIRYDRTRCMAKSIHSREDKKKNFSFLFLIRCDHGRCTEKSIHSQGRQYRFKILTKTESVSSQMLWYHVQVHKVLSKYQTPSAAASHK